MPGGDWAPFEVKLGASTEVVDGAAADLIALRDKVDAPPPVALGVITGSGYGIVRKDRVLQIPIGALRAKVSRGSASVGGFVERLS